MHHCATPRKSLQEHNVLRRYANPCCTHSVHLPRFLSRLASSEKGPLTKNLILWAVCNQPLRGLVRRDGRTIVNGKSPVDPQFWRERTFFRGNGRAVRVPPPLLGHSQTCPRSPRKSRFLSEIDVAGFCLRLVAIHCRRAQLVGSRDFFDRLRKSTALTTQLSTAKPALSRTRCFGLAGSDALV